MNEPGTSYSTGFSNSTGDEVVEVETERGIHLSKLLQREPKLEQSFEMARPLIEARLQMQRRSRSVDELVSTLKASMTIELAQVSVEGDAPNGQTSSPTPK